MVCLAVVSDSDKRRELLDVANSLAQAVLAHKMLKASGYFLISTHSCHGSVVFSVFSAAILPLTISTLVTGETILSNL
jgi:hypothetical protein